MNQPKKREIALFLKRLFCHHWFLPIQTGTIIHEIGDRREEIETFDENKEQCVYCRKIKYK